MKINWKSVNNSTYTSTYNSTYVNLGTYVVLGFWDLSVALNLWIRFLQVEQNNFTSISV